MGEKEETIQRLPDQLYEAYKLADSYAASTKGHRKPWKKSRLR